MLKRTIHEADVELYFHRQFIKDKKEMLKLRRPNTDNSKILKMIHRAEGIVYALEWAYKKRDYLEGILTKD